MNVFCKIALCSILLVGALGCDRSGARKESSPTAPKAASGDGVAVAGAAAPAVSLTTLDGKTASFADYAGKVVLLNFWATWCVPCVEEMPALERLQKRFGGEGLAVVSINVDPEDNLAAVKEFVANNGISFTVLRDPEFKLATEYGVTGFPESFFLDGSAHFLAVAEKEGAAPTVRFVGDRAWDSPQFFTMVEAMLAAQKKK